MNGTDMLKQRRLSEVKLCGTYMVTNLTQGELAKLDALQRACPVLDVQLIAHGDGYLVLGYKSDASDEAPLVRVENDSLTQAERMFVAAYKRIVSAAWAGIAARAVA